MKTDTCNYASQNIMFAQYSIVNKTKKSLTLSPIDTLFSFVFITFQNISRNWHKTVNYKCTYFCIMPLIINLCQFQPNDKQTAAKQFVTKVVRYLFLTYSSIQYFTQVFILYSNVLQNKCETKNSTCLILDTYMFIIYDDSYTSICF